MAVKTESRHRLGRRLCGSIATDISRVASMRPALSEFYLLRRCFRLAIRSDIEEILGRKAHLAGEQRGREALNAGIVFLHGTVEETPRGGDLVLQVGEFRLQLLEIGVGLEIRVRLRQRKQL